MSNLDADLAEMRRLGYGSDYGRYKRDHPNTCQPVQRPEKKVRRPPKATYEKTCAYCGKTFVTDRAGKIYCSDPCHAAAARKRYYQRKVEQKVPTIAKCVICGSEFRQICSTHICCSTKCNMARNRETQRLWRKRLKEKEYGTCV